MIARDQEVLIRRAFGAIFQGLPLGFGLDGNAVKQNRNLIRTLKYPAARGRLYNNSFNSLQ
jgi:hypothetical protein